MARFEVLQSFQDIYSREIYIHGSIIEMTVKRATEVEKNLKEYDGKFLERVKEE